jgi:hypothetical protein
LPNGSFTQGSHTGEELDDFREQADVQHERLLRTSR